MMAREISVYLIDNERYFTYTKLTADKLLDLSWNTVSQKRDSGSVYFFGNIYVKCGAFIIYPRNIKFNKTERRFFELLVFCYRNTMKRRSGYETQ